MKRPNCLPILLLICCLANQPAARAQAGNNSLRHLTIYSANLSEFLEERTVELQSGYNTVEWRSLMPKASIRTVRVVAEDAEVVRQDVTYDGAQVNSEKSPVLHLLIQNRGAAGPKRIQVDYLAPNLSWRGDYALVLEPTAKDQAPTTAILDSWVSLHNNTGVDLGAGTVDLVAGEIALLTGDSDSRRQYASQMTMNSNISISSDEESSDTAPNVSSLSSFNRFTLGSDIKLNANSPISRFPIFQHAKLNIVQRIVFENEAGTQTFGRGDFILLPRGLEVRLVAKNTASAPMAAGLVTIYQRQGQIAQIVGQDRIAFTPQNGEFTVSQGLSSTVFGTRRLLEHRVFSYLDQNHKQQDKMLTKVEVVLTNRGSQPVEAFVRENIEKHGDNKWKVTESTTPNETIGANSLQFKVSVPAGGKVTIIYSVECE